MSRFRKIPQAALAIAALAVATRLLTFVTQAIIAKEFGASALSDAYFAAESLILLLADLIVAGFSMAFIPIFAQQRAARGDRAARRFAHSFGLLSIAVSLALTALVALASPLLARAIAPGFHGQARELTVQLLRVMSLSIAFLGLTADLTGLLQSDKQFIVPELAQVGYGAALLGAALFLTDELGVMALAWGTVLASFVRLALQLPSAARRGLARPGEGLDWRATKRAAKLLLPLLVAHSGLRITLILDWIAASSLPEGSVAALNLASRVALLPVGILAIPLRRAMLPTLSQQAAEGQLQKMGETVASALRMLLFAAMPICAGLMALGTPLVRLLFERGAFAPSATLATSQALACYALGIPAIAGTFLLNGAYFALGDPVTPVKVNAAGWAVNLALNLILSPHLGINGIALATAASSTATSVALVYILRKKLGSLDVRPLLSSLAKMISASALMGALLLALSRLLSAIPIPARFDPQALGVGIAVLGGGLAYLAGATALKMEELTTLAVAVAGLLKPWRTIR